MTKALQHFFEKNAFGVLHKKQRFFANHPFGDLFLWKKDWTRRSSGTAQKKRTS
jgi:hypothetical protein